MIKSLAMDKINKTVEETLRNKKIVIKWSFSQNNWKQNLSYPETSQNLWLILLSLLALIDFTVKDLKINWQIVTNNNLAMWC